MPVKFAQRMGGLNRSEIREILKITTRPEIISFAGGLPAPELFPVEEVKKVACDLLDKAGRQVLQYATTEGYQPFRAVIAAHMNEKFRTNVTDDQITIVSGSQQALDFAGKIFIDEGDAVLLESPSYLGAINAFNAYGPKYVQIATDDDGLVPEDLERVLASADRVKFLYAIPDFQNPTGRTWSLERRKAIMGIVEKYELPVLEDNPYGELRFNGAMPPSLKSMDNKGLVIFLGTISKILAPGMRLGWVAADKRFLEKFITVKQSSDLHTSEFTQRIVYEYMVNYDIEEHIKKILALYKERCQTMLKAMEAYFPPEVKFTRPEGGLFLWVTLPEGVDAGELLVKSVENNVAFVPGAPFYPNNKQFNTMRLNFSNMPPDRIEEGIKRLSVVLKTYCDTKR